MFEQVDRVRVRPPIVLGPAMDECGWFRFRARPLLRLARLSPWLFIGLSSVRLRQSSRLFAERLLRVLPGPLSRRFRRDRSSWCWDMLPGMEVDCSWHVVSL